MSTFTWKRLGFLLWFIAFVIGLSIDLSACSSDPVFGSTADGKWFCIIAYGFAPVHIIAALILVAWNNPLVWDWFGLYKTINPDLHAAEDARAERREAKLERKRAAGAAT